jgi:hypothetical protein
VTRDERPGEDEPLTRPVLTARPAGFVPPPLPVAPEPGGGAVRPYLLTGGRTSAGRRDGLAVEVVMETVLVTTGRRAPHRWDAAGLERDRILRLCESPCSAAEVAALLHLPLQVALVLATDLVADGLLDASATGAGLADDVFLLERLIAGVAAL